MQTYRIQLEDGSIVTVEADYFTTSDGQCRLFKKPARWYSTQHSLVASFAPGYWRFCAPFQQTRDQSSHVKIKGAEPAA